MSVAKKCDRCRKYYDIYSGYSGLVPTQYYKKVYDDDYLDLCPKGYTDFEYWFRRVQVPYTYTREEYKREFGDIINETN